MSLGSKPSLKTLTKRAIQKRKEQQFPLVANAKARIIRMSPLKVRRVLRQIQGCSYEEALILLRFLPYRACHPVAKVLKSAAANALSNYSIPVNKLKIFGNEKKYVLELSKTKMLGEKITKPFQHLFLIS